MPRHELQRRVTTLERRLCDVCMAVIIIVTFFLYESLMPDESHLRT